MMAMFFTVPERHCVLIKRFNQFSRVGHSGFQFRLPLVESLHVVPEWDDRANKQGIFIELTEQRTDTRPRQCQTRDNVSLEANASIYWRIKDPVRACFEVDVLPDVIEDVALNSLRSNIGTMELDEVFGSRETLNSRIAQDLKDAATGWGVVFKRVEMQELQVDEHTRRAMTQQMEAERRRRAQIAESEGEAAAAMNIAAAESESSVRIAEGQVEALRMLAEAEADYLRTLKQEVGPKAAAQILLADKYIRGFGAISKNEADKVFLPNDFSALVDLGARVSNSTADR